MWALATMCLAGTAAMMAAWARRDTWHRWAAFCLFLLAAPVAAGTELMNRGEPVGYWPGITVPEGDHVILKAHFVVYEAIYLLLDTPGNPKFYELPWDENTARLLQDLLGQDGTWDEGELGAYIETLPFDWSWDRNEKRIHPLPQPQWLRDKSVPEDSPIYERQG